MACDASGRVDEPYPNEVQPKEAWLDDDASGSDNDTPCRHQSISNVAPKIRNTANTFRPRSKGQYHEDAHFGPPPAYDHVLSILDQHSMRPLPANYSSVRTAPNSREQMGLGNHHDGVEPCESKAIQHRSLQPAPRSPINEDQGIGIRSQDRRSRMRLDPKEMALRFSRKPEANARRQRQSLAAGALDSGQWSWKSKQDAALGSSYLSPGKFASLPSLRESDEEQYSSTEPRQDARWPAIEELNTDVANSAPSLVSGNDSWSEYMSQMEKLNGKPGVEQEKDCSAYLSNRSYRAIEWRKPAARFSSPQPVPNGTRRKVQAASWPLSPNPQQLYAAMTIASILDKRHSTSVGPRTDALLYFAALQSQSAHHWNESQATTFGKNANKESARSAALMRLTGAGPRAMPTNIATSVKAERPQPSIARCATSRDVARTVFVGDGKTVASLEAKSNLFTNLFYSASSAIFGDPPLEPGNVRVRWTCVSNALVRIS